MKILEEADQDDVTPNDNSNVENEDKVTTNFLKFQKSFQSPRLLQRSWRTFSQSSFK